MHSIEPNGKTELAILVGVVLPQSRRWEVADNISELRQLARTAGVDVVDEVIQERSNADPATFIGKGKVEELKQMMSMYKATTLIFDDDLSPAQIRNLEKATEGKIIDRSTLILDIFANHARTRESRTQVELAQLQHLLPRLTRQWTHLSRQVGGIGTKGPGETQLETDRRLIRTRIEVLRKQLNKIDQRRMTRRKSRNTSFKVSLIGYTNVGKSTIMNMLSGSEVLAEDQLFATLDSTVRRVPLGRQHEILLSDTVGFIRKLPHHLIESFKSTLDEVLDADLILHVVDISHPHFAEQIKTVNEVIEDLASVEKPILMVFNKIDQLEEKELIASQAREYPDSVFVSATRHIRTEKLKDAIIEFIEEKFAQWEMEIPLDKTRYVNTIHQLAVVTSEEYTESHVMMKFKATDATHAKIKQMLRN